MILLKKLSVQLTVVGMTAFLFTSCGNRGESPFMSRNSDENTVSMAFSDTNSARFQGGMFGGMGNLIDLTADQKQQIKTILEKFHPSRDHGERCRVRVFWKPGERDSDRPARFREKCDSFGSDGRPESVPRPDKVTAQIRNHARYHREKTRPAAYDITDTNE